MTQDRQNARELLMGKIDKGRFTSWLSPSDAEHVKDILDAGYGNALYVTKDVHPSLQIDTVAVAAGTATAPVDARAGGEESEEEGEHPEPPVGEAPLPGRQGVPLTRAPHGVAQSNGVTPGV